jgi:ethanolamine ammonia-lyase small subunit
MAVDLSSYTAARVGLDRRGVSLGTREVLRFDLDQARARDAVWAVLDPSSLGFEHVLVQSMARDRRTYLLRPDLGRRLDGRLERVGCEAAIVVADGLSALAVHRHAGEMVSRLKGLMEIGAVVVATQARVAIGDEIGEQLGAEVVVVLIGERPGLTSPDSLGAYVTYGPRPGRTDAERNCVSNIRPEGLGYDAAAKLVSFLMGEARARRLSGVSLKGDAISNPLVDAGTDSGS